MAIASKALVVALSTALAAPPSPACPDGATATANATWGGACFRLTAQRASLRHCVERCGEQGMAPACLGSAEENAFAAGLVPANDWAYIGHYQNDTSGGPAEGWGRCVAGDASGFANWDDQGLVRQPDDFYGTGFPEGCAVMTGQGRWRDEPCVVPEAFGRTFRCLCEGPSSPSVSFEQDLLVLEAAVEAAVSEVRARVAVVYPICFLIAFLPALLLLGHRRLGESYGEGYREGFRQGHREGYREGYMAGGGGTFQESASAQTAHSLRAAHRSAAQRRLRVSGLMAQSGWALFVFGVAPAVMAVTGNPIDVVVGPFVFWGVMALPGAFLLVLALLPTDARAIRTVCVVLLAGCAGAGGLAAFATLSGIGPPTLGFPVAVLVLATAAGMGPTLLRRGPRAMQPRQALRRLWLVVRLLCLAFGVVIIGWASTAIAAIPSLYRDPFFIGFFPLGATFIVCALLATTANRGRLHRRLGRLGGNGSEEEEAAAISALVAGADPDKALADAVSMFRCLRARSLTKEDLAGASLGVSTSAAELAAKTEPAQLHEVTCFLSHSWRDEDEAPGEKYKTFARWAREKEESTGEEVTLWLDKACIDQTNIDQALACLPVFLSGCQILLIVAGPTYCSRLWCVMEIFTFMRMGGAMERIELRLIANPGQNQATAKNELAGLLATFNAAKAECFKQEDRQKLLAVIEAGFGNFDEFNTGVREIFKLRRMSVAAASGLQHASVTLAAADSSLEMALA